MSIDHGNKDSSFVLKRIFRYLLPYKARLLWGVLCMFTASVLAIVPPWLLKDVIDKILIQGNTALLSVLTFALVAVYILKGLFYYGEQYLMSWVGQKVVVDIRSHLYKTMQSLPIAFFEGNRVGELISRLTNDVGYMQNLVTSVVVELITNAVSFLGIIAFLIYLNWELTIITFCVVPIAYWIIDRAGKEMLIVGRSIQEKMGALTALMQEAVAAIRIVKSFANEKRELERFEHLNRENFSAIMKGVQITSLLVPSVEVTLIAALAMLLWFGGNEVLRGNLTPGGLVAFLGYLAMAAQPIRVISKNITSLQRGIASAERIFEICDMPCEQLASGTHIVDRLDGRIRFKDVWFAYSKEGWVLKGIDLDIKPGETLAVVGPTGAGKSTLADMIPRFYDPQRGSVLIDERDVRDLELSSLRKKIGIVPQDPVLLSGTIGENISYGMADIVLDDIIEAAKIAGIHDYIVSLPDGYDTMVGERGVTLSGGQRQRIAIARVVIRHPMIIILDEATASLDMEVESQVQDAMEKAMKGRTAIIIAHRLSTIRKADRIIVMNNGVIEQEGTHDGLIKAGGTYQRLYSIQLGAAAV